MFHEYIELIDIFDLSTVKRALYNRPQQCILLYLADCAELYKSRGERDDGVYTINPDSKGSFSVYCDMTTDGGGWTIIQKRKDGSVDFNIMWTDYKNGFGKLNGEFWLGLEKIHRLTSIDANTLKIAMKSFSGEKKQASYSLFSVGDEASGFVLTAKNYTGE